MTPKVPHAHCHLCPLGDRPDALPIAPRPASSGKTRLIVIGENPTRSDENRRAAFSGGGGTLLRDELRKRGVGWDDCHLTYANLCRGEGDKENEKAAEACAPRLLAELGDLGGSHPGRDGRNRDASLFGPSLLLGKSPIRSLLGVRKAGYARGFLWRVPAKDLPPLPKKSKRETPPSEVLKRQTQIGRNALAGMLAVPTLSLSLVLKLDTYLPLFRKDLGMVAGLATGKKGPGDFAEEGGKPDAVGGLEVLETLGDEVACDIETDGIDPRECNILCVGFGDVRSGKVAVVWPWRDEYAGPLGAWLGGRKRVIGHNFLQFDALVLRAHGCIW